MVCGKDVLQITLLTNIQIPRTDDIYISSRQPSDNKVDGGVLAGATVGGVPIILLRRWTQRSRDMSANAEEIVPST